PRTMPISSCSANTRFAAARWNAPICDAPSVTRRSRRHRNKGSFSICRREAIMSQAVNLRRMMLGLLACVSLLTCGCSEIYYGRHDTISLHAGDAVATNIATHTIDVWPAEAGEQRIVSNGQKIQAAVERYRTNKVTQPVGTSSVGYQPVAPSTTAPSVSQ